LIGPTYYNSTMEEN